MGFRLPTPHLPKPSPEALGKDAMAALAVTFMAIPQGIAYAIVAGLPPAMGLYAAMLPAILGSLFRSSRFVVSGPTNSLSLLVGGGVATLAVQMGVPPFEVGIALAGVVGVLQVSAGLLRLGAVVDYISAPVVLGYITGAGVLIGVGQLGNLTETPIGKGPLPATLWTWLLGIGDTNLVSLGVGLGTMALVVAVRTIRPTAPSALIGLAVPTLVGALVGLDPYVSVIGDLTPVPARLPPLTFPTVFSPELFAVAIAATVLSLVESSAVARSLADRTGDPLNLSREFVGQGLSNLAAAVTGGYPVSGSLSRSALNHTAGAATRASGVFAGLLAGLLVWTAGPLVDHIPVAALAGLLLIVAWDLLDIARIAQTLSASRSDALAFLGTLIGTWTLRLDEAIYVGVLVSIVSFLRRARLLVVRELAADADGRLREVSPQTGNLGQPIRIVHVEGPLFFGAAGELRDALAAYVRDPSVKTLIVRLKRTQGLDLTTAHVLANVAHKLASEGRQLMLVGMRPETMRALHKTGVTDEIHVDHLFPTRPGWFSALDETIQYALAHTPVPDEAPIRRYVALRNAQRAGTGTHLGPDDEE